VNKNKPLWSKNIPYDRYFDFIAPAADRYAILIEHINKLNLNCAVFPIEGNRHIFIFPSLQKSLRSSGGVFPFKGANPLLFCAHYDRVEGSPGANDNSIAVFHLLSAAIILNRNKTDNWIIVFTDKEELAAGESFKEQGSYSLAQKLKSWGLEKCRIFNFDACGSGDSFIFSTTTDHLLKNSENENIINVRKSINKLRDRALNAADSLRLEKVLLAPTPFSDDAGFLRAGLAAQTVTTLPAGEAKLYEALLRENPKFADLIISGNVKEPQEYRRLPETWRNLNNANDTPQRLTPEFFELVVGFVLRLIKQ